MKSQSLEKLGVLGVDDYVDIVRTVWRRLHSRRTVFDYALHVLDHASKLGEAIRRDDANLILKEIAQTTNWVFGFVAKLNDAKNGWESQFNIPTKFSQMIWSKYPNICPHCFERVYISQEGKQGGEDIAGDIRGRCEHCLTDYPKVEHRSAEQRRSGKSEKLKHSSKIELRKYAQKTLDDIPKSLQGFETMFHAIYAANTALATLEGIGFHLLEEAGEMGRAVIDIYTERHKDLPLEEKQHSLCDEVAEVFSWCCSLTLKVKRQIKTFDTYSDKLISFALPRQSTRLSASVGLEEILWVEYRDRSSKKYHCPYCGHSICICKLKFAWNNRQKP